MTDITFPTVLPLPSTESYQFNPRSGLKRTEMSSGAARHRRVHRAAPDVFSMIWDMSSDELSVFEAFFNYDIEDGVKWFKMKHHTPRGMVDGDFRFVNPEEPYKVRNIGSYDFKVTASLERRNRILASFNGYVALTKYAKVDIEAVSSKLHTHLHDTLTQSEGEW
jgi:hypothetical protein